MGRRRKRRFDVLPVWGEPDRSVYLRRLSIDDLFELAAKALEAPGPLGCCENCCGANCDCGLDCGLDDAKSLAEDREDIARELRRRSAEGDVTRPRYTGTPWWED